MPIPDDFPGDAHAELDRLVQACDVARRSDPQQPTDLHKEYVMAHNAILYRFRACVDADEAYSAAFSAPDEGDGRYLQERELFNFFAALVSEVEVLCYCAFAIGSMANAESFPMSDESEKRRVVPAATEKAFASAYPDESTTGALRGMLRTYKKALRMRNVLSHRGCPPRRHHIFIGGGGKNRVEWGPYQIDEETTRRLRPWLSGRVTAVLGAMCVFAKSHL